MAWVTLPPSNRPSHLANPANISKLARNTFRNGFPPLLGSGDCLALGKTMVTTLEHQGSTSKDSLHAPRGSGHEIKDICGGDPTELLRRARASNHIETPNNDGLLCARDMRIAVLRRGGGRVGDPVIPALILPSRMSSSRTTMTPPDVLHHQETVEV